MTKNNFVVIDSSVIIKWLNHIDELNLPQAAKLLDRLEDGKIAVLAPELVKYEIGNALLKGKKLDLSEAWDALDAFSKLPLQIISLDDNDISTTYEIAHTQNVTFYDAAFLCIAKIYNAPLVTANPKHQKKFPGIKVIALKDYR